MKACRVTCRIKPAARAREIAVACGIALACLAGATCAEAQPSPVPGREARAPLPGLGPQGNARAAALTAQAHLLIDQAERGLPADWTTLCRATLALDTPHDSLASLRGKAVALFELSRDALRAQAQLGGALARLERARDLVPDDPALQHLYARALSLVDEPGPPWECSAKRRDAEAIAVLEALQRAHPSYEPGPVAFELGVLLTRSLRFAEASAAYEHAAALSINGSEGSTALSNFAETQMLAGELESAIASYSSAIAQAQGGREHALAVWGLALALDRNGEHDQALERLERAFGAKVESFSVLRSPGVFFVPACEVHAYEALGHASRARSLRASVDPKGATGAALGMAAELRAAAASYREYLAEAAAVRHLDAHLDSSYGAAPGGSATDSAELATQVAFEASAREGLERIRKQLVALERGAKAARPRSRVSQAKAR